MNADEIVLTLGYSKFNVLMRNYNEKCLEAEDLDVNGPPASPGEYRRDKYDLLRDMLISKKLIGDDVSLEYLKGLLNRLDKLDGELAK